MRTLNLSPDGSKVQYKFNGFLGKEQFEIEKQRCKSVPGATWNKDDKVWEYPVRPDTVDMLNKVFTGLIISDGVMKAIRKVAEQEEMIACMKADGWENVKLDRPMPVKVKPFKHQELAYSLACELLGVIK